MSYTQLTREEPLRDCAPEVVQTQSSRNCAAASAATTAPYRVRSSETGPSFTHWVYWYDVAHPRALERRTRARHRRRRDNLSLYEYVVQRLRARWSPECIAGRLALDYPGQPAMRVSPEAIYRWIVRDAQAGGGLYRCLCLAHKRRRKQRRYGVCAD